MNIGFVLLDAPRNPIGGYKIVYEYANRLQQKGFNVTIYYTNETILNRIGLPEKIRKYLARFLTQTRPKWMSLDSRIKKISLLDYKNYNFNHDALIATAFESVPYAEKFINCQKKFYFIQDFENWNIPDEEVIKTYNMIGWKNIVISSWLKEFVDSHSNSESVLIKNPIDTKLYRCVNSKDRIPHSIGLLYHKGLHKGLKYSFSALKKLKMIYPDLHVEMFGVYAPPKNIPDWIHYTRHATVNETINIYNKIEVFLCATIMEGYGLTGLEAMACGACLVSTEYKGVKEYAENNYNSLLSPIKDVDKLVNNVVNVFENSELRKKLIYNGIKSVQLLSWDIAVAKMQETLNK